MAFFNSLRYIILTIACVSASLAYSRTFHIANSEDAPLNGVSVYILSHTDSTIIDSAITDESGNVDFSDDLNPDDYISIRLYGYKTVTSKLQDIGNIITLEPDVTELNEVIVSASADVFKSEAGKYTVYPGNLKTEVPSINELLKFVPMVNVTEESLSFVGGRPAIIYLNGNDIKIPAEYVTTFIKSLNPREIKSIELIPNGNSSSGNTGIINIILIDQSQGLKGILRSTANYAQERPWASDFLSLNYARNKLNMDLILNYRFGNTLSSKLTEYNYIDAGKFVEENIRTSKKSHNLSGQFRVTYSLTSKDEIGLWFNIGSSKYNSISNVSSKTVVNNSVENSEFKSETIYPWLRPVFKTVAYWTHKTDSRGSLIDLTADYYNSNYSYNNVYYYDEDCDIQTIGNKREGMHFNAKYTQAIAKRHHITGSYEITNSRLRYSDFSNDVSNYLKYSELINSANVNWMAHWNENFQSSLNFTFENTELKGLFPNSSADFKRKFNSFLPYASISIYIPEFSQSLLLRGGSGVNRPFFFYLNPEIVWTSPTTYYTGNPDLKTAKVWYIGLDYSILNCIFVNAQFTRIRDIVSDYTYMKGDYTVSSYANTGNNSDLAFNIQYVKTFWNIWRLRASFQGKYVSFKGGLESTPLDYNQFSGTFSMYNMIVISGKHDLNVSLGYNYKSPQKEITSYTYGSHNLSFGIYKGFNNGMSLSFDAGNLLANQVKIKFNSPQYGYTSKTIGFPLHFSLSFDYLFGRKNVNTGIPRNLTKMDER